MYDNNCDTTCNSCGYVRTITHDYRAATCLSPKICNVCGATEGEALGHSYDESGRCTVCGMDEADGIVHISTAEQMNSFAAFFLAGKNTISAVLENDIDMSDYPSFRIGTSAYPFAATFDGNGHTLTVALSGDTYVAPFGFVGEKAVIKNLRTAGTVHAYGQFASGLIGKMMVGYPAGIDNCLSFVEITSEVEGDGTHGGLVAHSTGWLPELTNCGFLGSIKGEKTNNCGGLVGWANKYIKFTNCFVAAEFELDTSGCDTFARGSDKIYKNNLYYLNALGSEPSYATQFTQTQLENGELAYLLNGSVGGGTSWYQNIDNGEAVDLCPVPDSTHGVVYYNYANCDAEEQSYTNSKKTVKGHLGGVPTCVDPGYCTDCGEAYLPIDAENHATDETCYKTVDESEHGLYHSCCNAVIRTEAHTMTDATCTGVSYCTVCGAYYGSIDASNHSGEIICEPKEYSNIEHIHKYDCCGAVVSTEKHDLAYTADQSTKTISATCKDCDAVGSVTLSMTGGIYKGFDFTASYTATGIFSGWSPMEKPTFTYCHADGCHTVGTHHVTMTLGDVSVEAEFDITPKKLSVSSIKADYKGYDNSPYINVSGVYLDGVVVYDEGQYAGTWDDVTDNVGVDYAALNAYVSDCVPGAYTTATVSGLKLKGADSANYVIDETATEVPLASSYTSGEFLIYQASVNVTPTDQTLQGEYEELDQTKYELDGMPNGFVAEGIQLKENDYEKIYADFENLKVYTDDDAHTDVTEHFIFFTSYANLKRVCYGHTFNENGFCSTGNCNSYQEAVLNDNGTPDAAYDDYYEVSNAGQLYWVAKQINDYGKNDINVKLMRDITDNDDLSAETLRSWTPIVNYYGTFYGNGHSVAGLYCVVENGYAGFFGSLGYYPVDGLHIKRSYFKGKTAGALAGYSGGATVTKCSVAADVTVIGSDEAGGLIGNTGGGGQITDCCSYAKVSTTNGAYCGGLVGHNFATMENCCTNASAAVGYNNKNYGGSFDKVYFLSDTEDEYDGTVAKSAEDFESGALAYLMQSNVKGDIIDYDENNNWEPIYGEAPQLWGQKIGTDVGPTVGGTTVYEDEYKGAKVYRNAIEKTCVLRVGADKKSATVVFDKAGSYIVWLVDYDGKRCKNAKFLSATVTKAQAVHLTSERDFTLDVGDKVFVWSNNFGEPICEAYVIR